MADTGEGQRHVRPPRDRGFTLVEALITVSLLGLISAVVAAAFVVVVRTAPQAEDRVDDAKSLLSLTNWLSQDVSSTSENGFAVGNVATACAPASVPSSQGLLQLKWNNSVANYRWVATAPGIGRIVRFACAAGGTAEVLNMTPPMNEVAASSTLPLKPAPVGINLLPTTTGNSGNGGIEFFVYVIDDDGAQRELLRLDATTRNVRSVLPPSGGGGGPADDNQPPTADPFTFNAGKGQTTVYAPLPIDDPDDDTLFVTLDASSVPTWAPQITYDTTNLRWQISVTTQATDSGTRTMTYEVCDRPSGDADRLCTGSRTITVNITAPINNPPTADPFTIEVEAGQPVTDVKLPVGDENVPTLTVGFRNNPPNGWTPAAAYKTVGGVAGWYLSFPTNATTPAGSYTIEYRVTDTANQTNAGSGPQGWVPITVNVTPAPVNNPPTAGAVTMTVAPAASASQLLPVTDEFPASLTFALQSAPAGWNAAISSSGTLTFQTSFADKGTYTFAYRATDNIGQTSVWATIQVTVTNALPTAGPVSANGTKGVALTVQLPVSDPEGQPVTVTFPAGGVPSGWPTPTISQSAGTVSATLTPPTASGTAVYTYRVTDSANQSVTSTITITMCTVSLSTNSGTEATAAGIKSDFHLDKQVVVNVNASPGCSSLVLGFHPAKDFNDNPNQWITIGSATQVVIDQNTYSWWVWNGSGPNNAYKTVPLHVRQGITGVDEAVVNVYVKRV